MWFVASVACVQHMSLEPLECGSLTERKSLLANSEHWWKSVQVNEDQHAQQPRLLPNLQVGAGIPRELLSHPTCGLLPEHGSVCDVGHTKIWEVDCRIKLMLLF